MYFVKTQLALTWSLYYRLRKKTVFMVNFTLLTKGYSQGEYKVYIYIYVSTLVKV